MLAQDRADDMITGVVQLVDGIIERHIDQLRDAFRKRARELYGHRSEQLSDAQLELLFDLFREQVDEASTPELAGAAAQLDEAQAKDKPSEKSQRRRRQTRDEAFAPELPRETVTVPVPESDQTCATCGDEREVVGHDESEQLEYEPAQFRVRRIRREKRACRKCRDTVVRAPAPPRVVERGKLGAGLVAQVLVSQVPRAHAALPPAGDLAKDKKNKEKKREKKKKKNKMERGEESNAAEGKKKYGNKNEWRGE